ncbi:MAG: helix-hairpin-helix domain-containing protein [Verrucomicrobiales bacterium]|nr:helix-hairpin-helix domain-containing protein [Verrucomicrobiales bacterium]
MGKVYDEMIARRRAEMATGDKRQRLLLLGAIVVFAIIGLVLFAGSRMAKGPMDVNKASAAQLEKLPGIGPETAKAIISGRPYGKPDDLLKVKGIGPKTLEKMLPQLKFPEGAAPAVETTGTVPAKKSAAKK